MFFLEYLKNFFVMPALPSNEKNSSDYHNSYNKGPNLAFFSFKENTPFSEWTISQFHFIQDIIFFIPDWVMIIL
jgi:hypothetical protein